MASIPCGRMNPIPGQMGDSRTRRSSHSRLALPDDGLGAGQDPVAASHGQGEDRREVCLAFGDTWVIQCS